MLPQVDSTAPVYKTDQVLAHNINSEEKLNQLNGELEGRKISTIKNVALKILGVALLVAAVAIFALYVPAIAVIGYPNSVLFAPAIAFGMTGLGGLGVYCWRFGNDENLDKAQRALKHEDFLQYANENNISLTSENIQQTIEEYKKDKWDKSELAQILAERPTIKLERAMKIWNEQKALMSAI